MATVDDILKKIEIEAHKKAELSDLKETIHDYNKILNSPEVSPSSHDEQTPVL